MPAPVPQNADRLVWLADYVTLVYHEALSEVNPKHTSYLIIPLGDAAELSRRARAAFVR